jgi:Flp pilus assembly pilin Flp
MDRIHHFLKPEDASTATECAVMPALIIVRSLMVSTTLGTKVTSVSENVESGIPSSG